MSLKQEVDEFETVYYRQNEGETNQIMGANGENPSSELQKECLPIIDNH